jgi:hypothetical protein
MVSAARLVGQAMLVHSHSLWGGNTVLLDKHAVYGSAVRIAATDRVNAGVWIRLTVLHGQEDRGHA